MLKVDDQHVVGRKAARRPESGHHEAYASFSRTLRAWFVAYGIGGPVLILNQSKLYDALLTSGRLPVVAGCFLGGVSLQLLATIIYKAAMWYLYRGEYIEALQSHWLYRASDWLAEAMCVELVIDLATAALFAAATLATLNVVMLQAV